MSASNTNVAIPFDVPAHIRELSARAGDQNRSALGGIKAGGFPRISIAGSKFFIVENGQKELLASEPDGLPIMQLEIAVVGHNPGVSKKFYDGPYTPGDDKEPDCSSDDGIKPDPHISAPPAPGCAACPKNVWGSKVSEQGKQIKACSDNKRIAILLWSANLRDEQALDLTITPASLKEWANYVRALDAKGIPVAAVLTKVQFDPTASYPKLLFKFGRYLTPEEVAIVEERSHGDDVRLIVSPRTTTATGPVIPIQPVNSTPAQPAAPAVPAAPVAPAAPVVVDPYAGLPGHVKAAVDGVGGLTSDIGKMIYKQLTGKDAPTAPAAAPAAPPPPPPAPVVVDPYAGLAGHVKAAVDASGGLGSPAGESVYKALTGKDAPKQGAAAAAPAAAGSPPPAQAGTRRRRGAAAASAPTPAAAPQAPAAPAAPASAPTQAAGSYSAVPAAGGPGLGQDLDALLASAMGTPTGK